MRWSHFPAGAAGHEDRRKCACVHVQADAGLRCATEALGIWLDPLICGDCNMHVTGSVTLVTLRPNNQLDAASRVAHSCLYELRGLLLNPAALVARHACA